MHSYSLKFKNLGFWQYSDIEVDYFMQTQKYNQSAADIFI